MKNNYKEPEFNVVFTSKEDILTASEELGFASSNGFSGPAQSVNSWGGPSTGIEI